MKDAIDLKIKRLAFGIMILLLAFPGVVFAETIPPVTAEAQGYKVQIVKDDQLLNQPRNSVSYWFTMPRGGELSDQSYLVVHFSFSHTLIDERSTLSILLNGIPLETKGIYQLQEEGGGWWTVNIPSSKVNQNSVNEIKFTSNHRSIEGDCADIDNPDNWVVLHRDSYLYISMKSYANPMLSQFYPIYYDGLTNQDTLSSDFIVPENPEEFLLPPLLKLSSAIGQFYPGKRELDYRVLKEDERGGKNRIYIGLLTAWLGREDLELPANPLEGGQGFVSIAGPTGDQPFYSTVITAEDKNGLDKATNLAAHRSLLEQADQSAIAVTSEILPQADALSNKEGIYTFADFQYDTIKLAGAFHQKTYLSFIQPQGVQSAGGSYLNIKFAHSKALVSDRSVITVSINGTAVSSVKLTTANAEDGSLKVNIPSQALKAPVIEVGIECYNYLGLVDCSKDYSDSAWTVIYPDSEIVLPPGEVMLQPTLERFPYFYPPADGAGQEIVLGISNPGSQGELEIATLLAARVGQNTGRAWNWSLWEPNDFTAAQKTMDMVFMGSFQDIKLPQEVSAALAVAPGTHGELVIQEGVELIPETLQNKTIFQVIRSPWDPTRRVYVVMYSGADNGSLLNQSLKDRDILQNMNGQVGVLDTYLDLHTLTYKEKETVSVPKTIGDRAKDLERITHMPWWILLVLVVLMISGLITILHLRRVKNEFARAGKKMKEEQGFIEPEDKE